jgi:type II secretory pathway pseudopilin PulG
VIAIIAILAAILFPVFAQARAKARQVSCLSNFKQIGTAAMLYVQDYDETYPNNLALSIPGTKYGTDWVSWHNAKIAPTFTLSATGATYKADSSVAEQLYPYVKNLQVYLCASDPSGDRGASGRWTSDQFRFSYFWNHSVSIGLVNGTASGRPLTLSSITKPATEFLAQDNWTSLHSSGTQADNRWNVVFGDGHAKYTKFIDGAVTNAAQKPWAWDYNNPSTPVDVETPCSPDCKTVAAQG